jgi:hypothetical protein
MIWVGNTFYPGTGCDWNLPIEVQNPPAYAMQSDKSQYILESTGLEGYRGYGRAFAPSASSYRPAPKDRGYIPSDVLQPGGGSAFGRYGRATPLGWRNFSVLGTSGVAGLRGNIAMRGMRGNIALRGMRGNIALRGYGTDIYSASGVPARLVCNRTPAGPGRCRCQPSYTWDEYANRIQL